MHKLNLLLILAVIAPLNSVAAASDGWHRTFEEAQEAAKNANVPLLIHFHASWCGPCRQMEQQVLSQPDVQEQLRNGLAAVEVDVSQRPDLAQQFGATTVPRDVAVIPGQAPKTLNVGFKSHSAYLSLLRNVSIEGSHVQKFPRTDTTAVEVETAQTEAVAPQSIVGLEGFCPVRLLKEREWVSGRAELTETYRGITYYLSSEEAREEFRTNPQQFSPRNLGCDPVVLYQDQQAVTGKIKFGAFFDDQLYLFDSFENRKSFKGNPLKYVRIQHAIKIDDLAGQRFN